MNDSAKLELKEPTDPEGKETTHKIKKHEKDLAQHYKKIDKRNECKAKVFLVVKGQCNLSVKNKLEAMEKHSELEQNDDAVGLLKMIKELSCVSTEVKCQCWSMTTMLHKLVNMCQGDNETMATHCKRIKNVVDIAEGQWGESHPEKVAKNKSDYKDNTKCQSVMTDATESFWHACLCTGQTRIHTRIVSTN